MADHLGLQVEPSQELFTFVDYFQRNSGGIMRDLEVHIGNALVPVDFHVLDIKLNWNSSLLLGRAFLSTVGAVCNLQINQLCLTLIDPNVHYDPIQVKKPQMYSRRINDPGIIAACHCGAEYEANYSTSIETHTETSIDSGHQKSTDILHEESVNSRPDDWENDYYNPTIATYTRQHMHTEENAPSIDIPGSPSIDTQPPQRNWKRASTDIANYSSIDGEVNRVREGDDSIGSWVDDHHYESYAVETTIYEPGTDELHEGFTYEELLNMQRLDETYQHRSKTAWGRTRYMHSIDRAHRPSIDINPSTSIDINPSTSIDNRYKPKTTVNERDKFNNEYLTPDKFGIFRDPDGHAREIDGRILNVSRKDIADILQRATGAANLFVHQRNIPEYQQKDTKEFYDAADGIDKSFNLRSRHPTQPSIDVDVPTSVGRQPEFCRRAFDSHGTKKFYWEEKDQYGVYRDEHGYARDLDGNTIHLHNMDIRRVLERASRDEPSYICLPERANLFTQTKLVPEIYTKDEINEMFYEVCGEQEKKKKAFQLANYLHGRDEARHSQNSTCYRRCSIVIGRHMSTDIDRRSALETTEERLDGRCDDIYFPMDLNISALTSKIEAIQGKLVEIQSYIARRPVASSSIDKRNKKLTDIHHRTSVDEATNRGRLVPKMTSDMSDTHYHGEEISADTYATLRRHQFKLESLEERLQRMENTTATMKEKWRRGDEAMKDFTDSNKDTKVDQSVNYSHLLRLFEGTKADL
ncbi:hypothetical protein F2Q69_00024213 [Brassica cretica]|uniref:Uncharacterized protein n=1 Tax=Brassica cretica TaxID=69181 RepID=A0A8S9QNE6_BRACR|nr:hypothetical protein F2Q69_00024213 [Brassica cretica]